MKVSWTNPLKIRTMQSNVNFVPILSQQDESWRLTNASMPQKNNAIKCDICVIAFTRVWKVKTHKQIQTANINVQPLKCPLACVYCDEVFMLPNCLTPHTKFQVPISVFLNLAKCEIWQEINIRFQHFWSWPLLQLGSSFLVLHWIVSQDIRRART